MDKKRSDDGMILVDERELYQETVGDGVLLLDSFSYYVDKHFKDAEPSTRKLFKAGEQIVTSIKIEEEWLRVTDDHVKTLQREIDQANKKLEKVSSPKLEQLRNERQRSLYYFRDELSASLTGSLSARYEALLTVVNNIRVAFCDCSQFEPRFVSHYFSGSYLDKASTSYSAYCACCNKRMPDRDYDETHGWYG